jgi:hypothetical protein
MQWIKLTDRMPNPDEHERVLIYTEGSDFNGEQVFDVKAETLKSVSIPIGPCLAPVRWSHDLCPRTF